MREFVLPFKPEELLAQPSDNRLWASDLPPVDEWSAGEAGSALDALIGRLLPSHGYDIAEDESFSLVFALLQAWARLDDGLHARVVDLLSDAARRAMAEVGRVKKAAAKAKDQSQQQSAAREARTVSKVLVFFLRWAAERVLRHSVGEAPVVSRGRGRGKGSKRGASADAQEQELSAEEAKELQKAVERQRACVLQELAGLLGKGAQPWLWNGDPSAWQQVAQAVSDAGFLVLDSAEALKQREVRQSALRCISEPLLQEGHQHSNLLVATVSKLLHGLRSGESGAPFAADALALAHATPLPRLILVELTQHCNPSELTSQGAFQRALGSFLVAVADRLPHVVLANISVLLPLLDVDCYPLRNAIVESMGHLLLAEGKKLPAGAHCSSGGDRAGAAGEDGEDGAAGAEDGGAGAAANGQGAAGAAQVADVFAIATATKRDLLETLITRSLDKSVWVRYRVLQTLTTLASNTRAVTLPREQWARVLEIATRRMQDTASTTRKASMQLMRTLIEFHPYGPALQGSGDERIKAEHLLREVGVRLRKLKEEEVAEAEKAAKVGEDDMEDEPEAAEAEQEGVADVSASMDGGKRRLKKKTVTEQTIMGEVDLCMAEADEGGDRAEERKRQREALRRMQDCYTQRLHFVELLDSAEARLRGLLSSRTASDVTEAIGVVVELRLRGVPAAARAFDQVLGLVWSRQASIKDAAVDAFYRMHLEGRSVASAVQGVLEMYQEGFARGAWTYTHSASVQELIQQAAEKDLIDAKAAIPELVAALRGQSCPMALRALTAFGAANGAQLASLLPEICRVLGPGGTNAGGNAAVQLERVRLLCQLLQRLISCMKAPFSEEAWDQIWALSQHATHVVVSAFAHCQVPPEWYGAAQATMDLSFDIAMAATGRSDAALRSPDKVWEQILNRMICGVLRQGEGGASAAPAVPAQPIMDAPRAESSEGESHAEPSEAAMDGAVVPAEPAESHKVPVPQLGCAVFLGGHLALRMLVFLEGLQAALKRKRLADEDARMNEQREKSKQKKKSSKKGKGKGEEEEDDDGAQASSMGMAGQEEREADAFAELAENGLLYGGRSLLDRVKPLIFACLLDPQLRKDPILRRAGAIGLCKFMTVSKRFCEENLQVLFSILFPKNRDGGGVLASAADGQDVAQDAAGGSNALFEDLTLRQSLLVAVGDLLFRHPNVVEPWTGRLYGTLSSPALAGPEGAGAAELRLTALLVLTHLVLNDMMKPRAVLLVRALWLTACTHDATSRVARILFQELSKRSTNVVYNLLPEIIARLPEHQGSAGNVEGGAEGRVHYVMQFVEKEKHVEGLIEKLVIRVEQTANMAGSAAAVAEDPIEATADGADDAVMPARVQETISCLSHALGAMNYTDRCILRLHDAVVVRKAMHTAISYHAVARECLLNVVEKARRPRPGREKAAGEAPAAEAEAGAGAAAGEGGGGAKGGASAAAVAAIDAIEQTVTALEKGKEEVAAEPPQPIADVEAGVAPAAPSAPAKPVPSRNAKTAAAGKRKAEADGDNPGFDEEEQGGRRGRGRGRGRGGGRAGASGRGSAEKENRPSENAPVGKSGKASRTASKAPGAAAKRRRSARADDDDDSEE